MSDQEIERLRTALHDECVQVVQLQRRLEDARACLQRERVARFNAVKAFGEESVALRNKLRQKEAQCIGLSCLLVVVVALAIAL